MKNTTISKIKFLLKEVCKDKKSYFPLAVSNTEILRKFFASNKSDKKQGFVLVDYQKGDEIVKSGKITSSALLSNENYNYAYVPLGFIVKGEVIVNKGEKATKRLSEGDFIGLFETSDWIVTKQKREIGDWTLNANSDTKIIYFSSVVLLAEDITTQELRNYLIELARTDRVPQPITSFSLLDWVANHTTRSRLADYVIVVHTHLLPNTFPFFRHISYLTDFGRIYIMEKPYSTVRKTYNDLIQAGCEVIQVQMEPGMPYEFSVRKSIDILWAKVIEEQKKKGFKNLLIIDDGGDLWPSIPWDSLGGVSVAGVEQTQRGISRIENSQVSIPPVVSVATSGTKKIVESEFIGKSVVNKLIELGKISKDKIIGIMGMGSIGQAAANSLEKLGHKVLSYDPIHNEKFLDKTGVCPSIDNLLNKSDIIIGTTGKDSFKGIAFDRVFGHKILASASSADVEFASLLKLASPTTSPFETRRIDLHEKLKIDILNGGYPMNFDREKNAIPDEDIVLTWCLMYIGAMQAVKLISSKAKKGLIYNLDKLGQAKTLKKWIKDKNNTGNFSSFKQSDVERIVNYNTLENGVEMPSVWK